MMVPNGKGGFEEITVLRGERGLPGEPGKPGPPGTTSWDGITNKPNKFTPDSHKHSMADISDLPPVEYNNIGGSIVRRFNNGVITVPDPVTGDSATPRRYVDEAVGKKSDSDHTHSEYASRDDLRALIRLVDSAPASPEDGRALCHTGIRRTTMALKLIKPGPVTQLYVSGRAEDEKTIARIRRPHYLQGGQCGVVMGASCPRLGFTGLPGLGLIRPCG
ncbi:hypothetical protein [Corynebacterium minutissimum]|nr:hypothetical protein [Corynebacterium minutissimum]